MKVLLLNGSPHAKGCTYTALAEAAGALEAAGVVTMAPCAAICPYRYKGDPRLHRLRQMPGGKALRF